MCYEETRYVKTYWKTPRQELPQRQYRFVTEYLLVTGNTVEEMEADAIGQASRLTGRPAEVLEIHNSYQVHSTPAEGIPARQLSAEAYEARDRARLTGHALWSAMFVAEYLPDPEELAAPVFMRSEQVHEPVVELEAAPEP